MSRRHQVRFDAAADAKIRPTGRAKEQRERAAAVERDRSTAAQFRRVRLDEMAELYERSADKLEAQTFAWPDGMTRERAVQLIATVRPGLDLSDASDAYVAGALSFLVEMGLIDASAPAPQPQPVKAEPEAARNDAREREDREREDREAFLSQFASPHAATSMELDDDPYRPALATRPKKRSR